MVWNAENVLNKEAAHFAPDQIGVTVSRMPNQLARGRQARQCPRRQRDQRHLFGNDEFDKLIADARTSFDGAARDAALAKLHARIVEEAPFVWVAHDVGPRALSAKVKGMVQPKSRSIDIAPMSME